MLSLLSLETNGDYNGSPDLCVSALRTDPVCWFQRPALAAPHKKAIWGQHPESDNSGGDTLALHTLY